MKKSKTKKSKWYSKDVSWFSIKYKRPIAYSTIATSDFIDLINFPVNKTAQEFYDLLINKELFIRNEEAVLVMKEFIDRGLDNEIIVTKQW
jgi:hypothetical protein